jgi:hypothetical protein
MRCYSVTCGTASRFANQILDLKSRAITEKYRDDRPKRCQAIPMVFTREVRLGLRNIY